LVDDVDRLRSALGDKSPIAVAAALKKTADPERRLPIAMPSQRLAAGGIRIRGFGIRIR
jgi:hypothetical protein